MNSNNIAVLIPAFNEALSISKTLTTLLPQLSVGDRVVVVADNCTDETAAIARFIGNSFSKFEVNVLERHDLERTGKGYALDYGLKFLQPNPPSAVVVIDADCIVHPQTVQQLAQAALDYERPIQGKYLQVQPANPNPKDAISALAILVKNFVRLQGLTNLGLPCLLYGTGMAFPWSVIESASLANGNIVEDMQLAIDLAIAGHPPLFCPEAKVTGILPQENQVIKAQRTRWEHGHLQTLVTQVPRLLKAGISQRRWDLIILAMDLGVPPLSLLVIAWGASTVTAILFWLAGGAWLPILVLSLAGIMLVTSIVGSWFKFGRENIPGSVLLTIPVYILWKIPIYLAFLIKPQTKWIKTKRDKLAQARP